MLVQPCDQRGPQGGHGARAAEDSLLPVDQDLIAGGGVGITGDIRHTSSSAYAVVGRGRDMRAPLPVWQREHVTYAAAARPAIASVIPDHLAADRMASHLQMRAPTCQDIRGRSWEIDMSFAV